MKNLTKYFLLFSISLISLQGQIQKKVAAKVGDKEITISEFRERFELMPHITVRQFDEDSTRLDFLYSLIAEKLWAMEAENSGLTSSAVFKYAIEDIEKMFVRDALFKQEVESKITVTDKDVSLGMIRAGVQLELEVISTSDSFLINSISQSLLNGATFDSMKIVYQEISSRQPVIISFGDLSDEFFEDSLYALQPESFTSPLRSSSGWFIFKLNKKNVKPINPDEHQKIKSFIQTRIKERRAKEVGTKYLSGLLSGQFVDIDKTIFKMLSDKVAAIIIEHTPSDTSAPHVLSEFDLRKILTSFNDESLNSYLIKFQESPVSLKEYLYSMHLTGFSVNKTARNMIESKLASQLKSFTEQELITREGFSKGLHNLPEVKKEVQLWKDNYLAQILRNSFTDSARVNDDEVYQQYLKTLNDSSVVTRVNITEVLTDNLEVIEFVMDEVEKGKDFKTLAMNFTQREWVKLRGGEFGLFPVTMFGEIGKIAEGLNVGDVYGPLTTAEGYSIFKVLEKIESKFTFTKSFEETKDQIRNDLFVKKLDERFTSYTKELAKKYGIEINASPITKLKLTNVQMFTYRYMGFGGRITAVPYTTPWYEWYHQLQNEIKEVP